MGLTNSDCKLLFYGKSIGVSFENTLTLGRLMRYFSKKNIVEYEKKYCNSATATFANFSDKYSDELFEVLGTKKYITLDFSAYEGASYIHDLNEPIASTQYRQYSCVLDSGTIEHVFNFPVAIKNCMNMLMVGGHYISITPCNNLMGHGFYQYSPELLYRVFSEQNGFKVKAMFVAPLDSTDNWYKVADPAVVNGRVTLCNAAPLTLMVIAEKITDVEPFKKHPLQSDYSATWAYRESKNMRDKPKWKIFLKRVLPYALIESLSYMIRLFRNKKTEDPFLGMISPRHFSKVDI